jgi:catechol 2,3-dioxygenase-like lactoylglutathione lyase family enzyme
LKNGVPIVDEEDRKTGIFPGRQFYIHDPDRNVIEFSEFAGKEY